MSGGIPVAVLPPVEEIAAGALGTIDDGSFKRFPKPDVVREQHVMVGPTGARGGRIVAMPGDPLADASVTAKWVS